jgi:hypothetical protein
MRGSLWLSRGAAGETFAIGCHSQIWCGLSDEDIIKILGGNRLRVMREVE